MNICTSCGACFEDGYDLCAYDGGALTSPFPGPRVLGDRWLLEQRLASGAMGIVFRATHLHVGNAVAVKLMQPETNELQVALARFRREAQILGQVKHPNAVLVMDFGVEERAGNPVPYLVTELLRGEGLEALLERSGRLSLEDTERIITPLCEAVEEAHQVGVVHRDIKPSNVFLERLRDGHEVVKVLDFGIAKFVELTAEGLRRRALPVAEEKGEGEFADEVLDVRSGGPGTVALRRRPSTAAGASTAEDAITEAGFMVGTIPFMAPEQMTGGRVSRQTDVYAIASLVFRLLTGQLPFEGDDEEIIDAKLSDERPGVGAHGVEVPAALDEVLRRSLALQPSARPDGVLAISEALRAAVLTRRGAVPTDVTGGLERAAVHVEDLARWLGEWDQAADGEQAYHAARDALLALSETLGRLHRALPGQPVLSDPAAHDARARLEAGVAAASRALVIARQRERPNAELLDYVGALWARIHGQAVRALEQVAERLPSRRSPSGVFPALLSGAPTAEELTELEEAAHSLQSQDVLDSTDALERLLEQHMDLLLAALAQPGVVAPGLRAGLAAGLWRHADALLLADLAAQGRRMRLVPVLARMGDVPAGVEFARVIAHLSTSEPDLRDVLSMPPEQLAADSAERVVRRCLLLHPRELVRDTAARALLPADFWTVAVHPSTPLAVVRAVFQSVVGYAQAEYLKVFFLLTRENVGAALHVEEVREAFLLLRAFFTVPAFHEDLVFEPLVDLDRALRARAASLGLVMPQAEAYDEDVAAFTAGGAVESMPPASMTTIPLPIQRRLAREGHFLAYFVSHNNERVARETLPHLLRQEDVTRYLRIPTIHRAVLTELARNKRFFRQEGARMALLQNPRTPAPVARMFLPFVTQEQLRMLAVNRHIGAEVRLLAEAYLERLAMRKQ